MPLTKQGGRPGRRLETGPVKTMRTQARCQGILDEYNQAPRLMLVFPTSGQTWQLRLTPAFTHQLAAEVGPLVRAHRTARLRRRPARTARLAPVMAGR